MSASKLLAALLLALPWAAGAQDAYPQKPIRLVVPFAPGGGVDKFARPLAQEMSRILKQQVVIENRGGAGGVVGISAVVNAKPDGYTLLASTDTSAYLTTQVVKGADFDPVNALEPIASAAITPTVLVVHPSLPVKDVGELVAYGKANMDKGVPYVTAGIGSLHHLTGETLARTTGMPLLHIGYRGGSPALQDLLSGEVKVGILILSVVAPYIENGQLRALGVIEGHRSGNYPGIPTIGENGVPGFAMPDTSIAVWGPKGTPPAIVDRVNAAVREAMEAPAVAESLKQGGYEATPGSAAQFREQAPKSYALYRKLVAEARLRPQ